MWNIPPYGWTLVIAAAMLVAGTAPAQAASNSLSNEAFEQRLSDLQATVDRALQRYEAGDREEAIEAAREVREAFSFEGGGSSDLERKIKAISAVTIGDRVKALAARYVSAMEAGDPVEDVREIKRELSPSLNRLVLVAQGKHAPTSQRQLGTDEAIDEAAAQVLELVDEAVRLYEDGEQKAAEQTATEAFFAYETNGLGPDTTSVDDALENEVENLIKNFNTSSDALGLADHIANGSSVEAVREQADAIRSGLERNVELLKATKPPSSLGDANQDGQISIVDALLTAQASLGIRERQDVMDANQDAQISIVDALLIAQAALGIRSL